MGSVIDCSIIAAQTDGTLVVIETGRTKYRSVQMIKEQLTRVNARLLGVVLNKVTGSEYRYYYSEYDYYGGKKKYVKSWLQKRKRGRKE
jgi:Mrp family chromosome partitioning ATPase